MEVNSITENEPDLAEAIEYGVESIWIAKKFNNAVILCNLTNVKPVMHNRTFCSGNFHMPCLFLQIREEVV